MTASIRTLTPAILASALIASCSPHKADNHNLPQGNPYGAAAPTGQQAALPAQAAAPAQPINPIYDTPAAYEDNGGISPVDPNVVAPAPGVAAVPPNTPASPAAAPAAPPANGAAIIHTVVKGDTLSGIASKYKVPVASIKQANRMTNDTVILDRKMVIPPN